MRGGRTPEKPISSYESAITRTINHWIDGKSVASGLEAFMGWSVTPLLRRAPVMFKFGELIEANLKEMAVNIASEHGKILPDTMGSTIRSMKVVEFAARIIQFN